MTSAHDPSCTTSQLYDRLRAEYVALAKHVNFGWLFENGIVDSLILHVLAKGPLTSL